MKFFSESQQSSLLLNAIVLRAVKPINIVFNSFKPIYSNFQTCYTFVYFQDELIASDPQNFILLGHLITEISLELIKSVIS